MTSSFTPIDAHAMLCTLRGQMIALTQAKHNVSVYHRDSTTDAFKLQTFLDMTSQYIVAGEVLCVHFVHFAMAHPAEV